MYPVFRNLMISLVAVGASVGASAGILTAALSGSIVFSKNAQAADYPPVFEETAPPAPVYSPVIEETPAVPVEFGSGWYLRGDITMNLGGHLKNGSDGIKTYEYDDFFGGGIGAGYRFTNNFRADATMEVILSGQEVTAATIEGVDVALSSNYAAYLGMINGYYDLTPVGKLRPFIGAGVGAAIIDWNDTGTIDDVSISRSGFDYRLAWSVTAGAAYRLSDNMILDASYRFLNAGKSNIDYDGVGASRFKDDGFGAHQIRVGLRYELW